MQRRIFCSIAAVQGLACTGWAVAQDAPGAEQPASPHYTVTNEQLQRTLAQRFPLRYPVPGVLNLELQLSQLQLQPDQNRVSASMAVNAAGPALNRSHQGSFETSFALRYEASDRTLRAHQLRVSRLQFPTLQPGVVDLLNTYAPTLAQQSLLEVVVHTLRPQDLALADTMGFQPGSVTVTEAGLVIGFVPKPPAKAP